MKPFKPKFVGQRPQEELLLLLRRHWLTALASIIQLIAFNVLPPIIATVLVYIGGWELPVEGAGYIILVFGMSLYYIGAWLMFFHAFVDYHLDIWVLSNQRIINVEQAGLFNRTISELNIHKVQDVTSEVHGQIQTLFNFGNVYVQSAGEQQRFIFQNVPHPEEVARAIIHANAAALQASTIKKDATE